MDTNKRIAELNDQNLSLAFKSLFITTGAITGLIHAFTHDIFTFILFFLSFVMSWVYSAHFLARMITDNKLKIESLSSINKRNSKSADFDFKSDRNVN